MRAFTWTEWKRWIATLCVVLTAFVMVERAFCADPCEGESGEPYSVEQALEPSGDDHRDAGTPTGDHHCSGAHASALPDAPRAGPLLAAGRVTPAPAIDDRAPRNIQAAQERPPRLIAIA